MVSRMPSGLRLAVTAICLPPPFGHVNQHTLTSLVDTEGLALLLNVSHGMLEDVLPLGVELELAAELLFPAVGVDVGHHTGGLHGRVNATEDDVGAAADAVGG